MNDKFPEAGAVAFFGYKRTDGFEVSLTLKDADGKAVLSRLEGAIAKIKEDGGTPLPLRNGFPKTIRPKEYVEGRLCPKCNGRLVKGVSKAGKHFVRCENNKYDFATKQASGCPFIQWEQEDVPSRDISEY